MALVGKEGPARAKSTLPAAEASKEKATGETILLAAIHGKGEWDQLFSYARKTRRSQNSGIYFLALVPNTVYPKKI